MKHTILGLITLAVISACGGSSSNTTKTPAPSSDKPTTEQPPMVESPAQQSEYIGFESAPVRPIAMAEDKQSLFVANTSNNSLEWFSLSETGDASHVQSIPVGMEPVAVAVKGNQAWVVNHLSDSVSVVDFSTMPARVTRTLLVGDEPRDIVLASNRAFITTAHRGQQRLNSALADVPGAGDPQLHTSGVGRADIWVFDTTDLGQTLGGKPIKIMNLFGDTLRGLAVSQDESTLYAGVLNSGNQTTAVHEAVMCYGYEDDEYGAYPCQVMDEISSPFGLEDGYLPGGRTAPGTNADGEYQPWTSMIVKYDSASGQWQDSKGRNFSNGIRFNLPDLDVFAIDTASLTEVAAYPHVGTTLFNLATNPTNGQLYVTNTDANNATRFEGPGTYAGSTVQGNIAKSQVTVINPFLGTVKPRHLNRHINYQTLKTDTDARAHTLSTPTQMAVSSDGKTLYSAALGSNKIAVLPTMQLEQDSFWDGEGEEFTPQTLSQAHIEVAGGPSGLMLSESHNALYVFTRYDNSLVKIALDTKQEQQRLTMATFEPESFMAGRFMLYDANRSSSNGESSCASCHVFGDTDHLSWNLGNPDGSNGYNPQPFPTQNLSELGCLLVGPEEASCQLLDLINGSGDERAFASMKGPMGTQTLRGMQHHGHMHWRGDRSIGYFGDDTNQTLDERTSFKNFIVAFEGLLGMDIELPATSENAEKSMQVQALEQDMGKFADFMLRIALPPNPIRTLDNQLSASAKQGHDFFHGTRRSDGAAEDTPINGDSPDGVNCQGCHGVDPAQGFYGTRGEIAHGGEIQIFKVPQLRNLYTRVGMFGLPDREGFLPSHTKEHQGDQIRGFGFLHDGATDQLLNFLKGGVFDNGETGCPTGADERHGCHFNAGTVGIPDETTRQGLVDYMMEFDNDIAPIVGQQITVSEQSSDAALTRVNLLEQRAATPFVSKLLGGNVTECDLIAQGVVDGQSRQYFYRHSDNTYQADSSADAALSKTAMLELARNGTNSITFTCVLPGKGWQIALDRDLDGTLNRDEVE
ncbi:YncE family protein [Thalassotalea euphylliae]|uniref:YncE family protein n=1 Tax=Thalassotalea euphylliae TaxID=1655234 RepID=UPI00364177F5